MSAARYHHGDLPNALKGAAAELIAEKGPAGFSLREVARRAGVSHAAPAHHFGDSAGLLTALGVDAFRVLHAAMVEATEAATEYSEWGQRTYGQLMLAMEEVQRTGNPELVVADDAALTWSAMQGLVALFSTMPERAFVFGDQAPDLDDLVERVIRLILSGIARPA